MNFKTIITLFILLFTFFSSCDESSFLSETPKDFKTTETAYVTYADFEAAVLRLHSGIRDDLYTGRNGSGLPAQFFNGTEMAYYGGTNPIDWGSFLIPTNEYIDLIWNSLYGIIYNANVIIDRMDEGGVELNEDQKNEFKAEAVFFRAYCYKLLANLYGGVPLVLEEVTTPRRDYVRASREEVYQQSASDFEFAAENLPDITESGDVRINNLAAYHMLSEVYISLERWDDAITAASMVIDHPETQLMTERFGTLKDGITVDDPIIEGQEGDVYWDLYRRDNQNHSDGNREAIWVLQFGQVGNTEVDGAARGGAPLCRLIAPQLRDTNIPNADRTYHPVIKDPNEYYVGRGSARFTPSYYVTTAIWEKSGFDQDIRNSKNNIIRDFKVYNPDSEYHGLWVVKDNVPIRLETGNDTLVTWFPFFQKAVAIGQTPSNFISSDQTVPGTVTNQMRYTFRDWYMIRLAETYLLRAEAYLGNNNLPAAVADINVVRRRAQAPDASPSEVDIDYILDERLRELHFDEPRLFTLTRLGKLVERVRKYNPYAGDSYLDHNNLWPIPFGEIEKNIEGDIQQNPGYF